MASSSPVLTFSAAECYRSWTAFDALVEAVECTNYRSVWSILACSCCPEPHCWQTNQEILSVPDSLHSRILWYDNVQFITDQNFSDCDEIGGKQPSVEQLRTLQNHFVSHHQRIELILHCLKPSIDRIYDLMGPFVDNISGIPLEVVQRVVKECKYTASGWHSIGHLIRGVAQMDRIHYLSYVPRLAGVSGGNSPLMMPLTAKTGNMESLLLRHSSLKDIAIAIHNRDPAGRIAEAFIDCLDSVSRCWFDHVVTATTAIGITKGTKGTPNIMLVDRVLKRLYSSKILEALGSLRQPITGLGVEMHQLHNYSTYPLAEHYLDIFVDPGPEFGTHNVGWLPKEYERARADFLKIRRAKRTNIWEYFYSNIRPAFCKVLCDLLGNENVKFGFGSSVTEILSRLITTLQLTQRNKNKSLDVVLSDDEFLTMQRAAAILGQSGATIHRIKASDIGEIAVSDIPNDEKKWEDDKGLDKVFFISLLNSCTQRVQNIEWIVHIPLTTIVVLDVTQAVGNIPLASLGIDRVVSKPNVFLVGSLIKHARCGEGLAFISYNHGFERHLPEPASGWTAYCSGLRQNTTADFQTNKLYYDEGFEWDGGTPSWVESAYVATRILKSLPSIDEQHRYVKQIQESFLHQAHQMLSNVKQFAPSESNTLAIPLSLEDPPKSLPFGIDYKDIGGTTYLRIGFGIHNLEYHIPPLIDKFEALGLFK